MKSTGEIFSRTEPKPYGGITSDEKQIEFIMPELSPTGRGSIFFMMVKEKGEK